jgi:hypothetical protein
MILSNDGHLIFVPAMWVQYAMEPMDGSRTRVKLKDVEQHFSVDQDPKLVEELYFLDLARNRVQPQSVMRNVKS